MLDFCSCENYSCVFVFCDLWRTCVFCLLAWQIADHPFPAARSLLFKLHTYTVFSYVSSTDCARPHYTYLSALLSPFLHMPCEHLLIALSKQVWQEQSSAVALI